MRAHQAQRLLLFAGVIGALAFVVGAASYFGVGESALYTIDGVAARLLAHERGSLSLVFTVLLVGVPLLGAGCAGAMMELRALASSRRVWLLVGIGVWIVSVVAFVAVLWVLSLSPPALAQIDALPAEGRWIIRGVTGFAVLASVSLWATVFAQLARGAWGLPRAWAWVTPLPVAAVLVAVASLGVLPVGRAPLFVGTAPWLAVLMFFVALWVLRLRRPLEVEGDAR